MKKILIISIAAAIYLSGIPEFLFFHRSDSLDLSAVHGRSLKQFNDKFSFLGKNLESEISSQIKKKTSVHVLEFGFGQGRILMELLVLFPHIKTYGINKGKREGVANVWGLFETCKRYNIECDTANLILNSPNLFFFDANGVSLPFADNSIDLIYSQHSIQYLDQKEVFIEEAWRILSPGGVGILHINKFFIRRNNKLLLLAPIIKELPLAKDGKIEIYDNNILILKKNNSKSLGLYHALNQLQ